MDVARTNPKEFRVFCLPYHVVELLRSKDIKLLDVDKIVNQAKDSMELMIALKEFFQDKVSREDFKDIILANKFTSSYLHVDTYDLSNISNVCITDQDKVDFLNMYTDPSLDLESIIMSNSPDTKVPFRIETFDSIVFLILEKGITNFVLFNIKAFNVFFIQVMLNHMFKVFGESYTFNSNVFASFNSIQKYL